MKEIFPYHVVVDRDFRILQVGKSLPMLLRRPEPNLLSETIQELLRITQPVYGVWDWDHLKKLQDQTFTMKPVCFSSGNDLLQLKGNTVQISSNPFQVLLILSPDVKNIEELRRLGLTMSDLPLSSFQRNAVFLGEHISAEVKSADKFDRLSKKLAIEKKLSNTLLYSVLPEFVADDLRSGKTVDPQFFDEVTIFFSDIVSFTSISSQVDQWEVIDMLNRLFGILDMLCKHFGLYKIGTFVLVASMLLAIR